METQREIIKMHNHITYILEETWSIIFLLVAFLFGNDEILKAAIELISKGNVVQGLCTIGGIVVVLTIVAGWFVNRWYRTTFTVKDGIFTLERNTLNRKINTIALQNISNINLEQNIFEMICGTYKLKLDTNTLSTADETDVKIVLKKSDAYAVKNTIVAMMKQIQAQQGIIDESELNTNDAENDMMQSEQEKNYDIIYNSETIVKNCVYNTSVFGLICGVAFFVSAISSVISVIQKEDSIGEIMGVVFMQFVVGTGFITAMIKQWLNDFNFRVKRDKDKVYVSTGLVKKKKYAVPVDKINAVSLKSTFIGRIFRRAYVKVLNVGGEKEDVDGMKLLLFEKYDVLEEQLKVLIPELKFPNINEIHRSPVCVLVKRIFMAFVVILIMGILGYIVGMSEQSSKVHNIFVDKAVYIIIAFVAVCVLIFLAQVLSYRAAGISVLPEYLVVSSGVFSRNIEFIPYDKIQYVHIESGIIDRMLGIESGYVSILASTASRVQSIGKFKREEFRELEGYFRQTY